MGFYGVYEPCGALLLNRQSHDGQRFAIDIREPHPNHWGGVLLCVCHSKTTPLSRSLRRFASSVSSVVKSTSS